MDVYASASENKEDDSFSSIIANLNKDAIREGFGLIEALMERVMQFTNGWLQNQAVWKLNPKEIAESMGSNVDMWQKLLSGLSKAKADLESESIEKVIGCVHVNLEQVQSSMSIRYDALQKDLLTSFSELVLEQTKQFSQVLSSTRSELERLSVNASTNETINLILLVREVVHNLQTWKSQKNALMNCQVLLDNQNYNYPSEWIYSQQLENDWSSLEQILNRRQESIKASQEQLKKNIIMEDNKVKKAIDEATSQWEQNRPLDGSIPVQNALTTLEEFKLKFDSLNDQWSKVNKGRDALSLDVHRESPVDLLLTELHGLQEAWQAVLEYWNRLNGVGETMWSMFIPKTFNQQLNELEKDLESIPSRSKQYACFTYLQTTIRRYKKEFKLLQELKNSSLKERHWSQILSFLNLSTSYEFLRVRDFWTPEFQENEQKITDVLSIAQGELAIEEFLKQIREFWNAYQLELVSYQGRCKLIRGWEALFQKLDEHISALSSMKQSPYYRVFAEEAESWEDKVTRMRVLYDNWIDVQRRWVYLEGIFMSGADIMQQLPQDYNRFKSIDSEFISMMRKVAAQPRVIDVFMTPNIQRTLERLSQQLSKIQKALGEFLEKQRQLFSRFYFVGDEDLLEILGNSRDPQKVQRHLNKMFAGINLLEYSILENKTCRITAMVSKEGEVVPFHQPIDVTEDRTVVSWLAQIEQTMRESLASLLQASLAKLSSLEINAETFPAWIQSYPSQIVILSSQIMWCSQIEAALHSSNSSELLKGCIAQIDSMLQILAERVMHSLQTDERKKYEQLITEFVYEKGSTQSLLDEGVQDSSDFRWQGRLRAYYNANEPDRMKCLTLCVADASFLYGYEYLGVCERLVQTPLTDRCYLTLTQALMMGLGGNPFGPAGTGKTESVKMLASLLGRFCLVFNCDESFDFQAMGRIFRGLCQVGAWGCFDEFNRLEERILSAVSQQIWTIQTGLRDQKSEILLLDKPVKLHPNVGIFVTMNPGYAGRSNLPDNLKQLFRSIAMIQPDWEKIAQVMLFSQGFRTSEVLAGKLVLLFTLCQDQLSPQAHYDFGLRALKSVVVSAGNLKRHRLEQREAEEERDLREQEAFERDVLLSSVCDTIVPKLVSEDLPILKSLLGSVFTGATLKQIEAEQLRSMLKEVCKEEKLCPTDAFIEKALQLYQVQDLRHGVMLVGPSGSGKSSILRCLLKAMECLDGQQGVIYTIDPKAISKDQLFGSLDETTNEWTDGVFTKIIRQIYNDVRGESTRRQWIVFDGDVDPEWAENLNSVLDDNKLLTLPTGDRLSLPPNVRILFEVENLKYATPASVSRCGTVWFSEEVVPMSSMFMHGLLCLRSDPLLQDVDKPSLLAIQNAVADIVTPYCEPHCLLEQCLTWSITHDHIMNVTATELVSSFSSLLQQIVMDIVEYNMEHLERPMAGEHFLSFVSNRMIEAIIWGFGGSLVGADRIEFCEIIRAATSFALPSDGIPLLDHYVNLADGQWRLWSERVPHIEIDPKSVLDTSVVIPTVDTLRNQHIMRAFLNTRKPVILCGPPGSGKTMTLTDTLKNLNGFDVVSVNFSSTTSPSLIMKIFDQYGVYQKTPSGLVLRPASPEKWLIIFCDEVNLPEEDKYGTQRVISLLRQLVEQQGFWSTRDHLWVHCENIQFVAACNPPTDPGRVPLSTRFLSHTPLLYVDYPEQQSLLQIYSTFNKALVSTKPSIVSQYQALTQVMVDFYEQNKRRFSLEQQPQYVYSPRELSRWVRALHNAFEDVSDVTPDELIRLTAHEALRLFCDRLVTAEEKQWCQQTLDEVIQSTFPSIRPAVLQRPILYTRWLNGIYQSVDRETLRRYLESRLRVFNDEELNVPLVLFDDVLEHVIRIDRVLRQSLGHLLLVGDSGAGKTVLTRFVAWMNGISVFQIKVSRRYTLDSFDDDLRQVMRQAGVDGEQTCFIFDESNILSTGFLERMNALLASGEVPGLYEGDDMISLMSACREAATREGLIMDSAEELFKWFTMRVQRNLHVVFTMNPANGDFRDRAASSPALFNRCVVDWFGTWDRDALLQVSQYFTTSISLDVSDSYAPSSRAEELIAKSWGVASVDPTVHLTIHDAVTTAILFVHQAVVRLDEEKGNDTRCYCSPRDYLDFINHYLALVQHKREELEDQQKHLVVGLSKLRETEEQVRVLREQVSHKKVELDAANEASALKLKQVIEKKEQATQNQKAATELAQELQAKYGEIKEKRARVNGELSRVEPLLEEAKATVKEINKTQLNEIRSMMRPPQNVQLTIQAVCCLIGEESGTWKEIQKTIRKDSFIQTIVNFETKQITRRAAEEASMIMKTPGFTYETAVRSSKVCGPLYNWVKSQLEYSYILQRVKPLNDEMEFLTQKSNQLRQQHDECVAELDKLNAEIDGYTQEYTLMAQRTQQISIEIQAVTEKLQRSARLLESLESEQKRWKESSFEFEKELAWMIGDCLLGASFITYGGFFDQHHRSILFTECQSLLRDLCIPFNEHFDTTTYLSTSKARLQWQSDGLPADELCMQNAIILNRFNRYPLLIDPSGQGVNYIMNTFNNDRVIKTSFLDKNFIKLLESALRFGSILIVQDVENADPVLNPLLNKEFHKEGGRTLIRLGDQDIDFSPSFNLFLTTRDSSHQFPPDLCSRVTFVNFTMTLSSLQDQCLNIILQKEAPELYSRRNDLLQLQGEYQARLRDLEEQLLISLSSVQGNILDNDNVMNSMEQLKHEAQTITYEISQSDAVMNSIRESSCIYQPLSQTCSRLYFVLESLHHVFFLYRYNLHFFLDILHAVLNSSENSSPSQSARVSVLIRALYRKVYARVARGLKHLDAHILALRMCQLFVQNTREEAEPSELQLLLRGTLVTVDDSAEKFVTAVFGDLLNEDQESQILLHLSLDHTNNLKKLLLQRSKYWSDTFMNAPLDELKPIIDELGENGWSHGRCLWRWLLLIKELRPELLISAIEFVVMELVDPQFFSEEAYNLETLVEEEARADRPFLLCSQPGYDASKKVEQLYQDLNRPLDTIAMGNAESYADAEKLITSAAARGSAVLLRNVHLCPEWLSSLEKMIFTMRPSASFRLFMTSEISSKLPPSVLRLCYTLVFETPTGIRASLKHSLNAIPASAMEAKPVERCRVCFLLLWLHAVVEERLRYVPVGWTKYYEFSEADLKCSLSVIDRTLNAASRGLTHIDPSSLNWTAISRLLSDSFYGGRVDNPFDDELLHSLIRRLFVPQAFDSRFPLVQYVHPNGTLEQIFAPEGTTKRDFELWTDALPIYNSPVWLGLPATAEQRLLSTQGASILRGLLQIQDDLDVSASLLASPSPSESDAFASSSSHWLASCTASIEQWLSLLMVQVREPEPTSSLLQNPLYRCLTRELQLMRRQQRCIVDDLKLLLAWSQNKIQSTHPLRLLLRQIAQDHVPEHWLAAGLSTQRANCALWMQDFTLRCQHFAELSIQSLEQIRKSGIWLGGLFHPEAFITAMGQQVAQSNGWALDDVKLALKPLMQEEVDHCDELLAERPNAFLVHQLMLEGAEWEGGRLVPSDEIRCLLEVVLFEWKCEKGGKGNTVQVPIYLNESRSELLAVVEMPHVESISEDMWRQRAVAFIAWRQA